MPSRPITGNPAAPSTDKVARSVAELYHDLEAKVRQIRPKEDLTPLREAFAFAAERAAAGRVLRRLGPP